MSKNVAGWAAGIVGAIALGLGLGIMSTPDTTSSNAPIPCSEAHVNITYTDPDSGEQTTITGQWPCDPAR